MKITLLHRVALALLGIALLLSGLWVGAWYSDRGPQWAMFPTFATAFLAAIGGVGLFLLAVGIRSDGKLP